MTNVWCDGSYRYDHILEFYNDSIFSIQGLGILAVKCKAMCKKCVNITLCYAENSVMFHL